ncbi:hypothetical protein, partial [Xanthomonas arboricola]|uniref:hypothetical protein n=2 Tax=Xanthomonas TaxID=338 RepID=UPI001C6151D1
MAVAAMALFRNLLQSNWSAMLRLTQSSLRKVNLEPLFLGATEAQAQAFMDRDEFDVHPILSSASVWSPIPYPEEIGREET